MRNRTCRMHRNRGVILLLTLWIVTVLSLIAYSLAYEMRLEVRLTKIKKDNLIAFELAKAGVAKALCDLKNDMLIDRAEKSQILDAEGDIWKKPDDKTYVEMAGGTYSVRIMDEESLINLNTASPLVLKELIKYFIGEDQDEEANRIALAIIDWRDADDNPAIGEGQSEREIYAQKRAKDLDLDPDADDIPEYRAKNDKFTSVEELLEVYGITPEIFYGFDPETRKEELLRERARSERSYRHVSGVGHRNTSEKEDEEPEGLRDLLTVNSSGKVNVNTAGEAVLTAIIAAARINDPDPGEIARRIVEFRRGSKDKDFDNDKAFRNIGELSQVDGLSGPLISRMSNIQHLCTSSNNFRIIAKGRSGRAHRTIEAVVRRTYETFNVDTSADDYDPSVLERVKRVDKERDDDLITVQSPTVRILQWRER